MVTHQLASAHQNDGILAPLTGLDKSAGSQGIEGERVPKASCAMDCGLRLPLSQMYRSNARALPICLPCQNAKRTIISLANKTPVCKDALHKLQVDDPEGWKARVRSCRIVDPSAISGGADGVTTLAARRAVLHEWVSEVKQSLGAREVSGVLWLNRLQFIKHQGDLGTPRDEAAAVFDKRVADASVTKMRRDGDEVRIGVMDIPRTEVYRARECSQSIRGHQGIESRLQADDAVSKMAEVGVGANSVSSPLFGDLTDVFRAGNTVGSTTGQPLAPASAHAPPCNLVIPAAAFEGPVPKRKLSESISDPQEEVVATNKKKLAGPLAGVTGDLLHFRQRGLDTASKIWEYWGKAGKNRARLLLAADKRGEVDQDTSLAIKSYSDTLAASKTAKEEVKHWILINAESKLSALNTMCETLERLGEKLDSALATLVNTREVKRKAEAKARVEAAKERCRLTAVFKGKAPENILRYLYDKGALVVTSDSASGGEGDESQEVGSVASVELASNWPTVGADWTSFDHLSPTFFPPGVGKGDSVAAKVRKIPEALGTARIMQAHQDSLRSLSRPGQASGQGVRRLEPGAGHNDTLEDLDWVPDQFKATHAKPKKLSDFGAPSLLVDQMGECRRGIKGWPMVGLGQFAIQVKGESTLLCWPAEAVLNQGSTLEGQWKFLLDDLAQKKFNEFAEEHCHFLPLPTGGAVWIPYGHYVISMSRPTADTSSGILVQPFVSDALVATCQQWPDVKRLLVTQMGLLATTGTKVWKDMAPRAIEWLETPVDRTLFDAPRAITDHQPPVIPAIQDMEAAAPEQNEDDQEEDDEQEVAAQGEDKKPAESLDIE